MMQGSWNESRIHCVELSWSNQFWWSKSPMEIWHCQFECSFPWSVLGPVDSAVRTLDHVWVTTIQDFCHSSCQPCQRICPLFVWKELYSFIHLEHHKSFGLCALSNFSFWVFIMWAQSVLWWFLNISSLSALSRSPPCTQCELSIFHVVLEGL